MNCSELCEGLQTSVGELTASSCADCAGWNSSTQWANDTGNNTNVNQFYFYKVSPWWASTGQRQTTLARPFILV